MNINDCLAAFNSEFYFFFYNVTVVSFVAEMFHIVYFIYYIDMDIKTIVKKVYFLLHNFIFVWMQTIIFIT